MITITSVCSIGLVALGCLSDGSTLIWHMSRGGAMHYPPTAAVCLDSDPVENLITHEYSFIVPLVGGMFVCGEGAVLSSCYCPEAEE
jgi:hypothetical protein